MTQSAVIAAVQNAVTECVVDTLSTPQLLVVPVADWRAAAAAAFDAGAVRCEWLSAVELSNTLRVVALLRGASGSEFLLATDLVDATVASLTGLWPSCTWQERECAEMFGIDFVDHPDLRRLLLAGTDVCAPLRRNFPLRARLEKTWPGTDTASETGRPSQGRRAPSLPPGVLTDWTESSAKVPHE